MIYVISEANDITTDYVIEWLNFYKVPFLRTNFEDAGVLNYFSLSNEKLEIKINNVEIRSLKRIWHRRGYNTFVPKKLRKSSFYPYLKNEEVGFVNQLEEVLKMKTDYIGTYKKEKENFKIKNLLLARSLNFKIPNTVITTFKNELINFYVENKKSIITKDLRSPIKVYMEGNSKIVSGGTTLVSIDMIEKMNDNFALTLFQEKIIKNYEIRIFFFNHKLYCMAILSQNDDMTSIDYRNYNRMMPNRNIPVLIPDEIEQRVQEFIKVSKLSTGSIDLIVNKSNEYVFLEVNPQGQFDWVSQNCNYYIEKDIAEYLKS